MKKLTELEKQKFDEAIISVKTQPCYVKSLTWRKTDDLIIESWRADGIGDCHQGLRQDINNRYIITTIKSWIPSASLNYFKRIVKPALESKMIEIHYELGEELNSNTPLYVSMCENEANFSLRTFFILNVVRSLARLNVAEQTTVIEDNNILRQLNPDLCLASRYHLIANNRFRDSKFINSCCNYIPKLIKKMEFRELMNNTEESQLWYVLNHYKDGDIEEEMEDEDDDYEGDNTPRLKGYGTTQTITDFYNSVLTQQPNN